MNWSEIGLADMGDPDFRETMKDFQAEVSKQGIRKAKVAVFLPLEDVALDALSHDNLSQELAQSSGSPIADLAFTAGAANDSGQSNVLYAQRETLREASKFLADYGFSPTYFSARVDIAGFDEQPKLLLAENKPNAALAMWPAAVAALLFGAFGLWSFTNETPDAMPRTLQLAAASSAPLSANLPQAPALTNINTPILTASTSAPNIVDAALVSQDDATIKQALDQSQSVSSNTYRQPFAAHTPTSNPHPANLNTAQAVNIPAPTLETPPTAELITAAATASVTQIASIPQQNAPRDVDMAIPEDANYPRPPLRTGKRIQSVEPIAAPETAIVEPTQPPATEPAPTVEPTIAVDTNTPRPPKRSAEITAKAASEAAQKAIAQDLINQEIAKEQQLAAQLANSSRRAKGNDRRPPNKTANFRRLSANLSQPSKPAVVAVAATRPSKPAPAKPAVVASTKPAPSTKPTNEGSSRASTTFSKRSLSLVGVFGSPSRRSALFRTSTGSYRSVKIGQRISGWKVVSISESSAKVSKGSRSKTMKLPN